MQTPFPSAPTGQAQAIATHHYGESHADSASEPPLQPAHAGAKSWPDHHCSADAGLGIGANTAIFTVDYATLLAPLPYPQAQSAGDGLVENSELSTMASPRATFSTGSSRTRCFRISAPGPETASTWPPKISRSMSMPASRACSMPQMMGEPLFMGRYFLPEEGWRARPRRDPDPQAVGEAGRGSEHRGHHPAPGRRAVHGRGRAAAGIFDRQGRRR